MNFETLESFFISSARSAGARLLKEGRVSFSKPSETEINAYVKPSYRVVLKFTGAQSRILTADCNCTPALKDQLCKHIWAAFTAVIEKAPDFLIRADEVIKLTAPEKEVFKLKQKIYRREQYQKQKARAKEFKNRNNPAVSGEAYPDSIQSALTYFSKNGFSFENSLNEDSVSFARKKLSRIFHTDAGGTYAENIELNHNSEILLNYLHKT